MLFVEILLINSPGECPGNFLGHSYITAIAHYGAENTTERVLIPEEHSDLPMDYSSAQTNFFEKGDDIIA